MNIEERAKHPVALEFFNAINEPEELRTVQVRLPYERQYVLRMLIKEPFDGYKIPTQYLWVSKLIDYASLHQFNMRIRHPFCYLTIRHGIVDSEKDDMWHTDGFSQVVTHLPEQNYVWVNKEPTEWVEQAVKFPKDFDTLRYNVHLYLNDVISKHAPVKTLKSETLYCMDPYVIHRRPAHTTDMERTFVRISFTPIEIYDVNNTPNPFIKRDYTRDGVKSFRDKLQKYLSIA